MTHTHTHTELHTDYRALKSKVPRGVTVKNDNRRVTIIIVFGSGQKKVWTIIWVPGKLAKV